MGIDYSDTMFSIDWQSFHSQFTPLQPIFLGAILHCLVPRDCIILHTALLLFSCCESVLENKFCFSGDTNRTKTQYITVQNGIMHNMSDSSHSRFDLLSKKSLHRLKFHHDGHMIR